MILGLDIGNTSIVVGGLDESAIHFTAEFSTDLYKTSDEYAIMLKTVLEIHEIDRKGLEGAIIGTVVPALGEVLREAVRKVTGRTALLVGSGLKTGLNILIDSPAQAGSDLIVNALGALAQYPKPILIFDMGTATTLAVVNSKGNYVGGMIIPGVMLGMEALSNGTAQLPHISLEAPKKMIGTNTTDCMKSGAVYGNAAMLDGIISRAEEELGEKATVVATGGMAAKIVPYCRRNIIWDENLTLKGLLILYRKNVKTKES